MSEQRWPSIVVYSSADRGDWYRSKALLKRFGVPYFGECIHYCLGAPLAPLEAKVATQEILRHMRNIRPDRDGSRERADNPFFRRLKRLPLLFEPA